MSAPGRRFVIALTASSTISRTVPARVAVADQVLVRHHTEQAAPEVDQRDLRLRPACTGSMMPLASTAQERALAALHVAEQQQVRLGSRSRRHTGRRSVSEMPTGIPRSSGAGSAWYGSSVGSSRTGGRLAAVPGGVDRRDQLARRPRTGRPPCRGRPRAARAARNCAPSGVRPRPGVSSGTLAAGRRPIDRVGRVAEPQLQPAAEHVPDVHPHLHPAARGGDDVHAERQAAVRAAR